MEQPEIRYCMSADGTRIAYVFEEEGRTRRSSRSTMCSCRSRRPDTFLESVPYPCPRDSGSGWTAAAWATRNAASLTLASTHKWRTSLPS